jgi:hypothetical protein
MPARKPPSIDPPSEADDPEQSRRFIDMARDVEVDETSGAFDRAFKRIVPVRESPLPQKPEPGRKRK